MLITRIFSKIFGSNTKEIVTASDYLPYFRSEVIVYKANYAIPPFSAYLSTYGNEVVWKGNCGTMKDKIMRIQSTDKWKYSFGYAK